jgi:hypothetical protein
MRIARILQRLGCDVLPIGFTPQPRNVSGDAGRQVRVMQAVGFYVLVEVDAIVSDINGHVKN